MSFTNLPTDSTYSQHEKDIIKLWRKVDLLGQTIAKGDVDVKTGQGIFKFMDGPPFVNGDMHVGHAAVSAIKSAVLTHMRKMGFKCLIKHGWDCHGLPVENKVCKEKHIPIDTDVTAPGMIKEFILMCKELIEKYSNPSNPTSWKHSYERFGRLIDDDDTYRTVDKNFMESVWAIFKIIFEKNLVYIGHRISQYSWKNQTVLSNFEAGLNYKEKQTKSVYVSFQSVDDPNTFFAVWTTTIWTLPSNMALCVNKKGDYVKVEFNGKFYYVSEKRATAVFGKGKFKIAEKMKGGALEGMNYIPIFPTFEKTSPKMYTVLSDNYVKDTDASGTGIVHESPPFGEDDFRVCSGEGIVDNVNVIDYITIDRIAKFNNRVKEFAGMEIFDKATEIKLIIHLKEQNRFIKTEMITHQYPYCYRTDTPLIFMAVESVFVSVTKIKDQLLASNEKINWYPKHIGESRFKNWLENTKDWAVSRNRAFGTPIPLWHNPSKTKYICIGSVEELARYTGVDTEFYDDIHKDSVDLIGEFEHDGEIYTPVPWIFDCWFESGSVPLAQHHWPFENQDLIDESGEYLSDFIAEGLDQTRGWFYTLLVITTAVFDGKKIPYKNVMCTGLILDENGDKVSKSKGNYIDMHPHLYNYGADVLRSYFLGSQLTNAEPLKFSEKDLKNKKKNQIRYINAVKFFLEHACNFEKQGNKFVLLDLDNDEITNVFDRWVLSELRTLCEDVKSNMNEFKLNHAVDKQDNFIENLVNWYVKFNRPRMNGSMGEKEWGDSLKVLHYVLHTYANICSPITPFLSELVHQKLYKNIAVGAPDSILLMPYPVMKDVSDKELETTFGYLKKVCDALRQLRDKSKEHTSIWTPIANCVVMHDNPKISKAILENWDTISTETNCLNVTSEGIGEHLGYNITPNFKMIAKNFGKQTKEVGKKIKTANFSDIKKLLECDQLEISGKMVSIPQECYVATKYPLLCKKGYKSYLIDDIMISVDFTITPEIVTSYAVKCIRSAVQEMRKVLNLHPWDKVTVYIDTELEQTFNNFSSLLENTLSLTKVLTKDFKGDDFCTHIPSDLSYKSVNITVADVNKNYGVMLKN